MFIILWKFHAIPESRSEFESIYSPNGAWAQLFKKGTGYLGTELLRDAAHAHVYITLDRWASKRDYESFYSHYEREYRVLDAKCKNLTRGESLIGTWETVEASIT